MPTIVKLGNIAIRIFADDHNPPHFHIVTPEHQALVSVASLAVIAGEIDRRSLDIALEWAHENKPFWRRNGAASMSADEIIRTASPLPRIAAAKPLDGRKVEIVWQDDRRKTVDLASAFASRRVYMPLRDNDQLFRTLRVSDYGDAIEWDGGIDFSAVWIERLPDEDFGNADFRNAMEVLGLSLEGMAAALQVSRRQIAAFRKDKPIPRHIALATRYLLEHQGSVRMAG